MKAIARNSDIQSSHDAADALTVSGKRATQNAEASAMVKLYPGKTSLELSFRGRLDRYQLARRLSDCEGSMVKKGPIKLCSVGRRNACTWYPIDADIQGVLPL